MIIKCGTYVGEAGGKTDLDETAIVRAQVKAEGKSGIRVDLPPPGGAPFDESPNLFIERIPTGWRVFVHPDAGGDVALVVTVSDDGTMQAEDERGRVVLETE